MRMQANSCGQVLWYAELSPVGSQSLSCTTSVMGCVHVWNPEPSALGTLACRLEGPACGPLVQREG